ncbi:MAG: hypothetical protein ACR2NV_11615 [Thermoleophilaceae bacterium]
MTITAHTRNPHDRGYNLATGADTSAGIAVGAIYWSANPQEGDPAYLLRWIEDGIETAEEVLDTPSAAIKAITRAGYDLTAESRLDVERLAHA